MKISNRLAWPQARMRRSYIRAGLKGFACIALAFMALSCQKKPARKAAPAETWEPYISAFTSGVISREATIRVLMRNPVVADSMIHKPINGSPLTFTPAIKGTAAWIDSRTLEYKPEKALPNGQAFKAKFQLFRYQQVPEKLRVFSFDFAVVRQSIDVSVGPLTPLRNDDIKWQRLSGSLRTADVEEAERIESLVHARQKGTTLRMRWVHQADRLVHTFTVDSIERRDDSSEVQILWDGKAIGVDIKDSRTVRVPALGQFTVTDCRALTSGEQGISIRFSDPLRAGQNTAGLVTLTEDPSPRIAVEGNEIRVYFSKRLGGVVHCVVNPGILNIAGKRFPETVRLDVKIESLKPAVRFVGKGVILPDAANLTVPFEAVNLSAVDVRVVRIFESNIPQFLQVNDLEGAQELRRVGRTVFKQTVSLNTTPAMADRWVRGGFDMSPLVKKEPGALYRMELRFKKEYSMYPCESADSANFRKRDGYQPSEDQSEDDESEYSNWDYYGDEYEYDWEDWSQNRDNPCHPAYYRDSWDHKITATRNFLASNIGLCAKKGANDTVLIAATDLTTAQPLPGVDIQVLNYQNQTIGRAKTDADGFASVSITGVGKPYLCLADNGHQKGYLRLDNGSSLPVSHFDVGGAAVQKGLKGYLYGERGVWRPGDSLFLTFVLEDKSSQLPANHPVTLELVNPRGQIVQTLTRANPVDRFYDFRTATAPDAPTGNYTARVRVGGAVIEQTLKIEMVVPNRLKVKLDFGADTLSGGAFRGQLTARWLTGAAARGLKADVELTVKRASTAFPKFKDYIFDDPGRSFDSQTKMIFEGQLNGEGAAAVASTVAAHDAPGMLQAVFRTRVFEAGGAFSVDKLTMAYSPYQRYVGILLPRGDRARGMLMTDTMQTVHVVTVSRQGAPVSARRIQMSLYKVNWRWWWERGEESFSEYLTSKHHELFACDTIAVADGKGIWQFKVKYPAWGRFLVRAVDLDGGHAAGATIYMDWPQWAGRAQKEIPEGATVLAFSSDKQEYAPGEKAYITVPSSEGGRILISLENGSRVLRRFWADSKPQETVIPIEVTPEMAPTIYIAALYIQKYAQTVNDLPMRMYGVIPLSVVDPGTKLQPTISAPAVLEPESRATIAVSEKNGRAMTYTLALVDEGLLDLTRFETPQLWKHFYQREALGVMWWDLFDQVCGAWGAELERLLAIGGDEGVANPGQKRGNRFPPMVRFAGPFHLRKGATDKHNIDIPQYVGSVRIMVVAGYEGAYGSAETAVPVRKPLMLLGALPRVLSPKESARLPISVFALEPSIKNVTVSVKALGPLSVRGDAKKQLQFASVGDELVEFDVATGDTPGWAKVELIASGNNHRAEQTIEIEVRNPSLPVVEVTEKVLQAGESWSADLTLPGVAGTNSATIEISRIPPIDLTRRLEYLIGYPHGCAEQVTSRVFPQLFLPSVVELTDQQKARIQQMVQEGLGKIPNFQSSSGGFSFWPGGGDPDAWVTSYVGHFLLEAKRSGYAVAEHVLTQWRRFQSKAANAWSGTESGPQLTQAYRLFTLALAGEPELGAMNRLRESQRLAAEARWRLAAAYALAGQADAAKNLTSNMPASKEADRWTSETYGSDARDRAMMLEALLLLKDREGAAKAAMELARELTANEWMSTQTTAYALLAMAKFAGESSLSGTIDCAYKAGGSKEIAVISKLPLVQYPVRMDSNLTRTSLSLTNRSSGVAYARFIARGIAALGEEKPASEGMEIAVRYLTKDGKTMDVQRVEQGTDFIAEVTVAFQRGRGPCDQIALSQLFASGWEIRNTRFEGVETSGEDQYEYRDFRDDRVYTYFSMPANGSRRYRTLLHAAYIGSYFLPPVTVEAMYDGTLNARVAGQRVEVVEPGK